MSHQNRSRTGRFLSLDRRGLTLGVGVVTWICVVVAGFLIWDGVEARPGAVGSVPPTRGPGKPSVVVFVHPHCPCSREGLPELIKELRPASAGAEIRIVFVRPPGVPVGWELGRSWEIAAASGLGVNADPDGAEAAAEGAETSGYAVARDANGRVAFRGGIGRGRTGSNPGLQAVADVLAGRVPVVSEVAVYGCPLKTS
jgi:hypothetical protein